MANNETATKLNLALSLCVALVIFLGFWSADTLAVSTGDDLGYAFSDSKLHKADGEQIMSLYDIFSCQNQHYLSTNGRYIIHSIVQAFVSLFPRWTFVLANSLFFILLWSVSCKLISGKWFPDPGRGIAVAILIWLSVPRPGVVMLSLVAFAVNYLWTGAMTLLFLYLLERDSARASHPKIFAGIGWFVFSALIGSLQESFSLPVSGAIFVAIIARNLPKRGLSLIMTLGYWCGTLTCVLAPGNLVRFTTPDGAGSVAMGERLLSLGKELIISIPTLLFVVLLMLLIFRYRGIRRFLKENFIYLCSAIFSLLLCSVVYSAERQLTGLCLFSMIILGRLVKTSRVDSLFSKKCTGWTLVILYSVSAVGVCAARIPGRFRMDNIKNCVKAGKKTAYAPDLNKYSEMRLPLIASELFHRYTCDPTEGTALKIVGDGYTRRGLSRLYSPSKEKKAVSALLPVPPAEIMSVARGAQIIDSINIKAEQLTIPGCSDAEYVCFAVPRIQGRKFSFTLRDKQRPPYEHFLANDTLWYILASAETDLKYKY